MPTKAGPTPHMEPTWNSEEEQRCTVLLWYTERHGSRHRKWLCRSNRTLVKNWFSSNGLAIVQVIHSHKSYKFHCYSHAHSNHGMFPSIFCTIWHSFLSFRTWSFARFTDDLDSTDTSNSVSSFPMANCCGHVHSWESISGPQSVTRHYLIYNGLRGSIMQGFLERETTSNSSCRSPGSFIGSPQSLVHLSIHFPLLNKPKNGHHPTLSSLLRRNIP